ncbi:MAG: hypothetical protein IT373_38260 [Polyangiaceae bacterium]|nr:hypothetical protein [Polyangiaceae bacterium]
MTSLVARSLVVGVAVAAALGAAGCGREEKRPPPPDLAARAPRRQAPVDSTLPGELAEGEGQAFGFHLPRRMRITGSFPDVVIAEGPVGLEALANYVRERLEPGRVETGPSRTVFVDAKLRAEPSRVVQVEVTSLGAAGVELVVRDKTPLPVEPGLSEEERWRRAGLTPQGEPIGELEQ